MNRMTNRAVLLLGLVGSLLTAPVLAQEVFFGEDLGTGDNNTPLANTPNADAARADFFARLQTGGTGTEDFESFSPGMTAPLVVDFTVLTATLSGNGLIVNAPPPTTNGDGRFPTSGSQYWDTDRDFTIDFDTPVQAIGFYGIDMGDFAGQLQITYDDGSLNNVPINHTLNGPTGSVIYFGLVSPTAFSSVTFLNSDPGDVFGFDDFTVQLTVPPPPDAPSLSVPSNTPVGLAILIGLMGLLGTVVLRRA